MRGPLSFATAGVIAGLLGTAVAEEPIVPRLRGQSARGRRQRRRDRFARRRYQGNSHMMMMDNNLQVSSLINDWLAKKGFYRELHHAMAAL
jgi:hypothetical protein